jgi:putative ABC transport system permease protein
VRTAELTDLPPLSGGDQDLSVLPIGEPPRTDRPPSVWFRSVSPGYHAAMHMRLVAGRAFTPDDRKGAPRVAILNEEAARRYLPGKSALGRVFAMGSASDAPRLTIVGIVATARHDGPNQPVKSEMFVPLAQFPSRGATVVLEPARDLPTLAAAYRQALHEVDPLIPISSFDRIERLVGDAVALPRLYATLVSVFAAAALLLAALGVYGVMAHAVAQRQREIGVRLALGAAPGGIRRMVLGEGSRLALFGLVIGLIAAVMLGRALGTLLFGVSQFDAPTFVTVPLVLGTITLLACWLPARRAMRMDPLVAMRDS